MDLLSNYFNTLLGIEISVIGIAFATIFVFIQLIYSRYSQRLVRNVVISPSLYLFGILSLSVLVITALASLSLAVEQHDVFRERNFGFQTWITGFHGLSFLWLLLIATALSFVLYVILNFANLHSINQLRKLANRWNTKSVSSFLRNKYGIKAPYLGPAILIQMYSAKNTDQGGAEECSSGESDDNPVIEIGENLKHENRLKAFEESQKQYRKRYDALVKSVARVEDIFSDANAIAIDAILKIDIRTYEYFVTQLENVVVTMFESVERNNSNQAWNPDSELPLLTTQFVVDILTSHLEASDQQGLGSIRIKVIEFSGRVADLTVDHHHTSALQPILKFWKEQTDKYCRLQPRMYSEIIKALKHVIEKTLNQEPEDEMLSEMFRSFGWLGEKYLLKGNIEEEPYMPADDYRISHFDDVMNAILSFSQIYDEKHPQLYPLIFFDAVTVITKRVISSLVAAECRLRNRDASLFNLIYIYYSFGKAAISAENVSGAELSAMRLAEIIDILDSAHLDSRRDEAIDLLLEMGAFAAGNPKLRSGDILMKPIKDYAIEKVLKFISKHDITSTVFEIFLKREGEANGIRQFVVDLSDRAGNEFGLNISNIRKILSREDIVESETADH